MEEKEYLQTLGEQILNPHARTQCAGRNSGTH